MTQIPQNPPLFGAGNASNTIGTLGANGRRDVSGPSSPSAAPFSQWLNQSSQQMKVPVPTPVQAPAPASPAANAAPKPSTGASNGASNGAGNSGPNGAQNQTASDENKLAARNAANRQAANRQAESPKAAARPAGQDGQSTNADAAARADGKDTRPATGKAKTPDSDQVQARDAKSAEDADKDPHDPLADATATPAQQILALLRGDAPPEAKLGAREGAAHGEETDVRAGDSPVSGSAHGKSAHATALQDSRQLQQDLRDAARGALQDASAQADHLEGAHSSQGAHEIALADAKPASGAAQPSFDALLAAAQGSGSPSATGADATARSDAPSVPLSQPLHSPDFAPELSASVSLLIQDGVHEAQLQLNPTEMGPVAIHIQLDGQQAQVNFHAEQAATREVLERSLPDLAAALQAQGLTLSGGGVFAQQQSANGQSGRDASSEDGSRRGGRGGPDDGGVPATGRAERRTAPRGLVDLYA